MMKKQPKRSRARKRETGSECCAQAEISAPTEDEGTKLIEQNTSAEKGRGKQELSQILYQMGFTQQQIASKFAQLEQAGKITVDDVGTVFWKGT